MEVDEAQAIGERNQAVIDLVERHCRNARVEKSPHFGEGLVEAMTGLPIGGREVKCPHAVNPSMAGMQLENIAVDFYRRNCIECPHREVVDIPNLKTFVDELDGAGERETARRNEEAEVRAAEQIRRSEERERLVKGDPKPVRDWIALIDGIDRDEPDERAQQFLDTARGGAELCTPGASQAIVDAALAKPSGELCEAVDFLNVAGRIADETALKVALQALALGPNKRAVTIVVRLRARLGTDDLVPCMSSAIRLAGPVRDIPFTSTPADVRLLELAAELNLPALLDHLVGMLTGGNSWERGSAGAAAAELARVEPGSAEILAGALVESLRLPESTSVYAGSPRRGISQGLEAALVARPREVAAHYLKQGRELSDDERETLFRSFDQVIRSRMRDDSVPEPAGEVAVDSLLEIAGGPYGERSANSAADSLELAAKYHPELLIDRPASLIGALMSAVSTPVTVESGTPPQLTNLAQGGQEALPQGRVSHLTTALGNLAIYRAGAVSPELFAVLDGEDPPGEAALQLRASLTKTLGSIGVQPDLRQGALQRLYGGLLSQHQIVRAAAIVAWEEMAAVSHFKAPPELEDLILPLLTDPFVVVHLAMVKALKYRIPVPERHRERVALALLQLAEIYEKRSNDRQALESILDSIWFLSRGLAPAIRHGLRRRVLALAKHLDWYALERLVERVEGEELTLDEYADRLLEALAGTESTDSGRIDHLMQRLRDLPAASIESRAAAVSDAARTRLPQWTGDALEFVEVLQAAGLWAVAVELATDIADVVPEDTEHAAQRARVLAHVAQARFEAALEGGEMALADEMLEEWREWLNAEREREAREARSSPFDLPGPEDFDV